MYICICMYIYIYVKFAAAILYATFSVLHPPLFTPYSGGSCSAIPALRFGEPSRKGIAALQAHLIGFGLRGPTTPSFTLVAELSFVILLATPCTALALSRPLLNFDFILLPWPCAGPLFCASALSRPCCTFSGPEQAWLQFALFWPCAGPC